MEQLGAGGAAAGCVPPGGRRRAGRWGRQGSLRGRTGLPRCRRPVRGPLEADPGARHPGVRCSRRRPEPGNWLRGDAGVLKETRIAQPAAFVLDWALAQMWLSWGVKPGGPPGLQRGGVCGGGPGRSAPPGRRADPGGPAGRVDHRQGGAGCDARGAAPRVGARAQTGQMASGSPR